MIEMDELFEKTFTDDLSDSIASQFVLAGVLVVSICVLVIVALLIVAIKRGVVSLR